MKKKTGKLTLKRSTLSNLKSEDLNRLMGGVQTNGRNCSNRCTATCFTCGQQTCGRNCGSF